jgi:hypothetical protein
MAVEYIVFFVVGLITTVIMWHIHTTFETLDALKQRVQVLSNSCQLAEIHTGRPYFTSLGHNLTTVETTEYIYDVLSEKLRHYPVHETLVRNVSRP